MSTRVNLNDNISDAFQFTIGGLDYDFKYPTMEDFGKIQRSGGYCCKRIYNLRLSISHC